MLWSGPNFTPAMTMIRAVACAEMVAIARNSDGFDDGNVAIDWGRAAASKKKGPTIACVITIYARRG